MARTHRQSRRTRIESIGRALAPAFVLFLVLMLTGCSSAGAAPPGVTAVVFSVVTAVWNLRKMGDDPLLRDQEDGDKFKDNITLFGEHVKFFIRWRAEELLKTQSDTNAVANAVALEYDQVRSYIQTTIGLDAGNPGPLVKGSDKLPPHLPLDDFLRPRTTSPDPVDPVKKEAGEHNRWKRSNAIIWRAAAVEPTLWDPSFSSAALDELLDRRLRIIERCWYQIDEQFTRTTMTPDSGAPHGPWPDHSRTRAFEYPELDDTARMRAAIGAANIGPPGGGSVWYEEPSSGELVYNQSAVPRWHTRIRDAAAPDFAAPPPPSWGDDYGYALAPTNPADALDRLFTPSEDYWDRSWIYCDEVLAALHLESLRFGKLRRLQDNDATFNGAVAGHPPGWAGLRPVLGPQPDWRLVGDDGARPPGEPRFFSNGAVRHVQLGDHVIFFNSIMYGLLNNGAWSLENAVVVALESDWTSNDYADGLKLMGHGTSATTEGKFRKELTDGLNEMLDAARTKASAAPPAVDNVPLLRAGAPLVKWAPYAEAWVDEDGDPQPPWWIRIPFSPTGDWIGRAIGREATLRTIPDAVEADPSPIAGYQQPPAAGGGPVGACYFPLWTPTQPGGWNGYLKRRKAGSAGSTFELRELKFTGKNIPALVVPAEFVPGATSQQVYAARPYVTR
jgi:hypothetical protein